MAPELFIPHARNPIQLLIINPRGVMSPLTVMALPPMTIFHPGNSRCFRSFPSPLQSHQVYSPISTCYKRSAHREARQTEIETSSCEIYIPQLFYFISACYFTLEMRINYAHLTEPLRLKEEMWVKPLAQD